MSYVSKKLFPELFTFGGVKSFILRGIRKGAHAFLGQKQGTFHPGGEKLGEKFIAISLYFINIYNNFSPFTPDPRAHFVRAYAREEKGYTTGDDPADSNEYVCFSQWSKVMACDWCGEFEPDKPMATSTNAQTSQKGKQVVNSFTKNGSFPAILTGEATGNGRLTIHSYFHAAQKTFSPQIGPTFACVRRSGRGPVVAAPAAFRHVRKIRFTN